MRIKHYNPKRLIQTAVASIIYGEFRGEPAQELFRCPRELDEVDLKNYINRERIAVQPMGSKIPLVNDNTTINLRNVEGKDMIGYWRMYYRNGWDGRWMLEKGEKPTRLECKGVNEIIDWLLDEFPDGCDYYMKDFFNAYFKKWGGNERYLVMPFMSEYYKVMVDTTYGNGDYPVRIYLYRDKESASC